VIFIGAEPFLNGVASLLRHVDERGLGNVRIHPDDVRDLLDAFRTRASRACSSSFPDPWPKARHHKRRLLQPTSSDARPSAAPGGRLRFATDWESYAEEVAGAVLRAPELAWTAESADDWRTPARRPRADAVRGEAPGDIAPVFFDFVRR
jgi:tRNA (guanine-N7-)-methyltransferase